MAMVVRTYGLNICFFGGRVKYRERKIIFFSFFLFILSLSNFWGRATKAKTQTKTKETTTTNNNNNNLRK